MKNCGNCANYDRMKEAYTDVCGKCFLSNVNKLEAPSQWKPLPMTNADRIRAMSDEELADWALYKADVIGREWNDSYLGLIKWLQQPAEGE